MRRKRIAASRSRTARLACSSRTVIAVSFVGRRGAQHRPDSASRDNRMATDNGRWLSWQHDGHHGDHRDEPGANVRRLREARGLSQQQMAKLAGICRARPGRASSPAPRTRRSPCCCASRRALQVSIEELIGPPRTAARLYAASEVRVTQAPGRAAPAAAARVAPGPRHLAHGAGARRPRWRASRTRPARAST